MSRLITEYRLAVYIFQYHLFYKPGQSLNDIKSITKESRGEAYNLLLICLEVLEPHELATFLEVSLWPLIKDIQRPKKWKFIPADG
jgi:hypothetical protein